MVIFMADILSDIQAEILNETRAACEAAAIEAAKKIEPEFEKQVLDKTVKDYYESYSPKKYKRKKSLYKAWEPQCNVKGSSVELSAKYDTSLMGQHTSNSWYHQSGGSWVDHARLSDKQSNGLPENDWIFSNFLQGEHPIYVLNRQLDIVINNSKSSTPALTNLNKYWDIFEVSRQDEIIKTCILEQLNKL